MNPQTKTYADFLSKMKTIPNFSKDLLDYYNSLTILYENETEIGISEALPKTTKLVIEKHINKKVVCPL